MTAYFSTTATLIPVLLIAGILSPTTLRDYSRRKKTAWLLEIQIGIALLGSIAAVVGLLVSISDDPSDAAMLACQTLTAMGLTTGFMFLLFTAHTALHQDPHPDRLKSEEQDLEHRLFLVRSKQREIGIDSGD